MRVSVCLCEADQSIKPVSVLNVSISKTVKATYFEFGMHVPSDSSDITAK